MRRAIRLATDDLLPDLTLVLDVPRGLGEARRARGRSGEDRIERAGAAFHDRVAEAYRLLADTEPQTMRLDGTGDPAVVQAAIRSVLARRFPETFASAAG